MKYNQLFTIVLLLGLYNENSNVQGIRIQSWDDSDDPKAAGASEIDQLMDKYDGEEAKKDPKNMAKAKKAQLAQSSKSHVSASAVQDMELKILSGNNVADSS